SPPPGSKCSTTTAMPARASSSPTRSSSAFRIGWSWASAASTPASSSTATGAQRRVKPRKMRNSRSTIRWGFCNRASGVEPAARSERAAGGLALCGVAVSCGLGSGPARADQQKDPELRATVERAIAQAECFTDQYDSAVWYKMMEPRLRKSVPDHDERMEILK